MLKKCFAAAILVVCALAWSSSSDASTGCYEHVTSAVIHGSGGVYFKTDQTCPNWCQLNWSPMDTLNKGYAMLLTAETTGKTVYFSWPNISVCTATNANFASPDYMEMEQQ